MSARMFLFVDIRNEMNIYLFAILLPWMVNKQSIALQLLWQRIRKNSRSFSLCYNCGYDVYALLFSIVLALSLSLLFLCMYHVTSTRE